MPAQLIDMGLVAGLLVALLVVRLVAVFVIRWCRGMAAARARGEWSWPWERRGRHAAGRVRRQPC